LLADALARGAERLDLPDGIPMALAVSGGADSTALMHAAAALAPPRGWRLLVGHLDHGLRDGSAADGAAVVAAAESLGLTCKVRREDVRALAAAEHRSLEDAGRQARYRFLHALAEGLGPDAVVATAHTADDQAETVLLRLARGAGLRGVRGIPERRGRVVRPFLHERRAALRGALDLAGIAYRDDPTNLDPAHAARNRARLELLPALERISPAAVEAIARFADLAAADDALLDALAAAELARRRGPEGSVDWKAAPGRAVGRRVLRLAIGEPAPSAERIEALLAAAEGTRGGVAIELGGGRRALVRARRITFV
jgi:tRNA(Ile)-lysidine synthase